MKRITMNELAERINAHLKRFEADKTINVPHPKYKTSPYFLSHAASSGPRIHVSYVNYQGSILLKREAAERYLAWLDSGNVGTHYEYERTLKENHA